MLIKEGQDKYFDVNRKLWDAKTLIHLKSSFYNLEEFYKTRNSLNKIELDLLPDIKGKTILHSQCHFGQDTISLQNMGAQCLGFDLSPVAIEQAKSLNQKMNLGAKFLESNIYELDQKVNTLFDLVFTSYGVIAWLPDLGNWAKQLMARLKPGGQFIIVEFHPIMYLFDWDSKKVAYRYFNNGEPYMEQMEGTYADRTADIKLKEYFWQHSMDEIMSSLIEEGLIINKFKEYDYSPYSLFEPVETQAEKQYIFKVNDIQIPLVFALVGTKIS